MAEDVPLEALSREALLARARTLDTVLQVAGEVAGGGTVSELCSRFAAAVVAHTRFAAVAVVRFQPAENRFDIVARLGAFNAALRDLPYLPRHGSLTGLAADRGHILTVEDLEHDDRVDVNVRKALLANAFTSGASVPLFHGGELLGAYNLMYPKDHPIPLEEREMLASLGHTLAAALAQAAAVEREQALQDQARRAQQLESLGVLAGGIAHDFNNLLTAILGNVELSLVLAEQASDAPMAERLAAAMSAGDRASGLSSQLLTLARGDAPSRRPSDQLEALLEEVAAFTTTGTSVQCQVDIEGPLGVVEIDAGQIAQVIQNLVLNACQASPSGSVVMVTARRVEAPTPRVQIDVRDHGRGIAPEDLPRIFEPFFSAREGGTGLGLSVSHAIVTRHEGTLTVTSEPGVGTTFTITLPATSEGTVARQGHARPLTHFSGPVLVMDDDDQVRLVATHMLQQLGFEVTAVSEGSAAVHAARVALEAGAPLRAALLDLTIVGGRGGPEVARQLRALSPNTKLVLASGYAREVGEGWDGILQKPYRLAHLSEVLSGLLEPVA